MIDRIAQDRLFLKARTHHYWLDKPVDDALLVQAFDLAKMAPTSANCQPMRVVFVKSASAKEKLKPCLDAGNIEKTMSAPVTAIIAQDMAFYEQLPRYFPHTDAKAWFVGKPEKILDTAFRNATLQGAYLMLALRAVGLDVGPMSGFNLKACDEAFFSGTNYRSNFLCNIGYGNAAKLHPQSPRPTFSDSCRIV
jgi:3-hydroxypropanoate dehydrogenase